MSTISKIEEILGKITAGEYVAVKKDGDGFKGHVVTLDPSNIKAIDIDVWTPDGSEPEEKYMGPLCFTAQEDNATVGMAGPIVDWDTGETADVTVSLQISKDEQKTWTSWDGALVNLSECENGKLYVKALNPNTDGFYVKNEEEEYEDGHKFIIQDGKVAASGNIQYLLDPTGERMDVPANCYAYMFSGCTSLTQAPELPATELADYCYGDMFFDCTSLTQAPELPATDLADECYCDMFFDCTSLTQTPELPATVLADYCYAAMFDGCTSLAQAPELPATTLAKGCYQSMFFDCTSLTQTPELPATTLVTGCYQYMFYGCTSLTQAPELPATDLASDCYDLMFQHCEQVSEVHMKSEMNGVYSTSTHGDTTKTVVYDL